MFRPPRSDAAEGRRALRPAPSASGPDGVTARRSLMTTAGGEGSARKAAAFRGSAPPRARAGWRHRAACARAALCPGGGVPGRVRVRRRPDRPGRAEAVRGRACGRTLAGGASEEPPASGAPSPVRAGSCADSGPRSAEAPPAPPACARPVARPPLTPRRARPSVPRAAGLERVPGLPWTPARPGPRAPFPAPRRPACGLPPAALASSARPGGCSEAPAPRGPRCTAGSPLRTARPGEPQGRPWSRAAAAGRTGLSRTRSPPSRAPHRLPGPLRASEGAGSLQAREGRTRWPDAPRFLFAPMEPTFPHPNPAARGRDLKASLAASERGELRGVRRGAVPGAEDGFRGVGPSSPRASLASPVPTSPPSASRLTRFQGEEMCPF
ncbi:collagen alpha-1(I) chain-like [Mustela putorius furo]|uniref:Collagen alpha-1(I) chain-like n=1 Tax=Mustela putorius furo TaxID=9669 RepID=A0A8U0V7Z7_MUSPF|nr:collagen alpha-1(I) chain-like [Mustela putorius furo]